MNKTLLTAFLVSLSFGLTQVPIIYVIGVMTCDEYYKHHRLPEPSTPEFGERCHIHAIDASTARAVALLGAGTTFFGIANLFITGWTIKAWGVKRALLITIFWPVVRLAVQNIGVEVGAGLGVLTFQLSQIINILGGPAGYLLALNSFATEIVLPAERTASIGRLTGYATFGSALGFFAGGILSDVFGLIAPFRVALCLICMSTVYSAVFLPTIPKTTETTAKMAKGLRGFIEPLKMFTPQKWLLPCGTIRREYGVLLLGVGAFLAVFATGYIPVLLQMYATGTFGFQASENSRLVGLNFVVRAIFLSFGFPAIIEGGRRWLNPRQQEAEHRSSGYPDCHNDNHCTHGDDSACRDDASRGVGTGEQESFAFDLFYTRYSLILDGVLTGLATFTTAGWQMYPVAAMVSLAAGTGSAAKGTMLQMCAPEQKTDALSAISLLEMVARLSTISVFGLVYSAFAEVGASHWTFLVNGAVAVFGFLVLLFAHFPPHGATRYSEEADTEEDRIPEVGGYMID